MLPFKNSQPEALKSLSSQNNVPLIQLRSGNYVIRN